MSISAPKMTFSRFLMYLFVIVVALLMFSPVVVVILGSIRTTGELCLPGGAAQDWD
ncbi:MAG: hypothetical protein KF770_13280 [Anaerolineae bacterium]|nr:hypothetical protein [Anaerolineae bacterium]